MPSRIDNARNYLLAQWIQLNLIFALASVPAGQENLSLQALIKP
jgi:hypothetical protein